MLSWDAVLLTCAERARHIEPSPWARLGLWHAERNSCSVFPYLLFSPHHLPSAMVMASRLGFICPRPALRRRRLPPYRMLSSAPSDRPFRIHVGASFAGKPPEFRSSLALRRKPIKDFPPNSDIALWRAQMLSRPKSIPSKDAGEDFYYVQEVCITVLLLLAHPHTET